MMDSTNQNTDHFSLALLNLPFTQRGTKFKLFSSKKELGNKYKSTFGKRLLLFIIFCVNLRGHFIVGLFWCQALYTASIFTPNCFTDDRT